MLEPASRIDPFPIYRQLLSEHPVSPGPHGGLVFARHADVSALFRDPRISNDDRSLPPHARFAQPRPTPGMRKELEPLLEQRYSFAVMDPPDHTRLRRLTAKGFSPAAIERLRPMVERLVDELIDAAAAKGRMDVIEDFAHPLHIRVTCELLGLPIDHDASYRAWTLAGMRNYDPPETVPANHDEEFLKAGMAQGMYFEQYIASRRAMPRTDDILSMLFAFEEQGELTAMELSATYQTLVAASYATVVTFLGNCMLALLRHPDQLARLRRDPSLAKPAVEEILRYEPPAQYFIKIAKEPIDIAGVRIRAGQPVYLLLAAANRDPERFHDPDRLDIGRIDNKHLGWGAGIHFCLGAPLARLESQIALVKLVGRLVSPRLDADPPPYLEHIVFRGPASVPISFDGVERAS
ncbi:MAG TPA: cytochrome P450 [Kofleriaceae bacterium]|nr:cytochrome P450 [Kofleriaceae bacterium]